MPEEFQPEAPPVEDGQGAEAVEGGESAPSYFDLDQYADHLVKVTVDGEEMEVPLRELPSGFSRQADYTRKTQELARQREQLQFADAIAQGLAVDPQQTLAMLAERYGMVQQDQDDEDEFLDPLERKVLQQEKWINAQMQRDEDRLLREQLEQGSAVWEDVDPREAVAFALQHGLQGPNAIPTAFAALAGNRLLAQRAAERQTQANRAAADEQALAAKRAAQIIEGGSSAVGVTSGPQSASSVHEAFQMAKRELGLS